MALTPQQFKALKTRLRGGESGYFSRVGQRYGEEAERITGGIQQAAEQFGQKDESIGGTFKKTGALLRGGLRTVGGVARAAFAPITELPGIKQATEFVGESVAKIPGIDVALQKASELAKRHPESAKDIEDVLDTLALLGGQKVSPTLAGVAQKGKQVVKATVPPIRGGAAGIATAARTTKDIATTAFGGVQRIPSRIATNVAEKRAQKEAIRQLPVKSAQEAVQQGVDIADVKQMMNLPKAQVSPLRKLLSGVQKYARGETETNPIEIVGRPMRQGVQRLESAKGKIGQQLGEVANNLGEVSTREVFRPVFDALQKVPGLNGLRVSGRGELIFGDTVLASALSKNERKAIQKIFIEAVKAGSGKSKHLLRQELFEILGGKKRALTALTDTQEKAFDAVRSGLSNVLEGKNTAYKTLSNEYRKIVQPLQNLRRFFKNVAGADEDILDMNAGLLARRLTSAAPSNPQIRAILRSMDNALATKGKTLTNLETLQDFYNILDRYYDIAPKTGFQGQVKTGVEKATSGTGFMMEKARELAGETPAVRQKALEALLADVLR